MLDAQGLKAAIGGADFRGRSATVVGYGNMGREYFKALRLLGVGGLRVCSRSEGGLDDVRGESGIDVVAGGVARLDCVPDEDELGIVAVPTEASPAAVRRLLELGFRRVLVEKPVAFQSDLIRALHEEAVQAGAEVTCAFNRTFYPAFFEVASRVEGEGGITSCHYEFTELIRPDWPQRFAVDELARWGIANSIHVISMAHGLIGLPREWHALACDRNPIGWHPGSSTFVGAGATERGVAYSYHADWGSTGRWGIELHTAEASYRLCPLEAVQRRAAALGPWVDVPIAPFADAIKPGVLEQVACALGLDGVPRARWDLQACSLLVAYIEDVCGYNGRQGAGG